LGRRFSILDFNLKFGFAFLSLVRVGRGRLGRDAPGLVAGAPPHSYQLDIRSVDFCFDLLCFFGGLLFRLLCHFPQPLLFDHLMRSISDLAYSGRFKNFGSFAKMRRATDSPKFFDTATDLAASPCSQQYAGPRPW
jgi:hypothetical protein